MVEGAAVSLTPFIKVLEQVAVLIQRYAEREWDRLGNARRAVKVKASYFANYFALTQLASRHRRNELLAHALFIQVKRAAGLLIRDIRRNDSRQGG